MNHPAVLLRRSVVLALGNYRSCPGFEDYELWLRLLKAGCLLQFEPVPQVFCRTGLSHLARRNDWLYAAAERAFLWRSPKECLILLQWVLLSMLFRLPLRPLLTLILIVVMNTILRSSVLAR